MQSVAADTRNRRTRSPAEAMNALTVGALHDDADTATHAASRLDPIPAEYPSPLNLGDHPKAAIKDQLKTGHRDRARPGH